MKKIVLAALATTVAMASTPALAAADDSKDFRIRANVAQECSVEDPDNVNFGRLSIDRAPGSGALLVVSGRQTIRQNVWVSCNYGASMSLTSDSMTTSELNDGPDAADFTAEIPLRMGITASDGTAFNRMFFDTLTKSGDSKVNADAFHDDAELSVVLNPLDLDGKRPLAGRYQAVATLSVGAI